MPQNSTPGVNGSAGRSWYWPLASRTSGKFSAVDQTSTSTCPGAGSGTRTSTRWSTSTGSPSSSTCHACMRLGAGGRRGGGAPGGAPGAGPPATPACGGGGSRDPACEQEPAVDDERLARDPRGVVRREERDGGGDVVRGAEPPQRVPGGDLL